MAKGYWIARMDVTDPETYQRYVTENGPCFARFGGRFVVRGGRFEAPEGPARSRNVVLEFPSYEAALACYNSREYQALKALRTAAAEGELIVIEGHDGAQPGDS
jgi:uncharacterized protein (DUF1330 family)